MITLYDYELSGNCYKLRLLLSFLKIEYKTVPVEFYPGQEHKSDWFLKINPLGQLPVIDDDGFMLRDAQAILVYLASRYDPTVVGIHAIRNCSAKSASGLLSLMASPQQLQLLACTTDCSMKLMLWRRVRARIVCFVFSTSISGFGSTSSGTGFAMRPIQPSPISPVFLTSCCLKKAESHARIIRPFAAGAIDSSGSVVSSSCRASSRRARRWLRNTALNLMSLVTETDQIEISRRCGIPPINRHNLE